MNYYQTTYAPMSCSVGVVHIGFGAFHRAHQAVYFDDYMEKTSDLNWGIAAVNLNPSDSEKFKNFSKTNGDYQGYMLKTIGVKKTESYRLVRSHLAFIDWTTQKEQAEDLLKLASVQVVTVTITESGYYLDKNGSLNIDEMRKKTQTIYHFLAAALRKRHQENGQPLTIICCDNINGNGHIFKRNFMGFLESSGLDQFKKWVVKNVSFPCSMVDRITPRTSDLTVQQTKRHFPAYAEQVINAEDFSQWVIEDNFMGKKPALGQIGVEFVDDITPYEETKIRILNGGHTCLAYLGVLNGYHTFDEAMSNQHLRSFFEQWQDKEVLPGITRQLPLNKNTYKNTIAERFSNAGIADSLERVCMDGFMKFAIFIKPTIESCLQQNITPINGYRIIASWYIYARCVASGDLKVNYIEPNWSILEPLLEKGQEERFASLELLWEDLPSTYPQFKQGVLAAINELELKWLA